MTEGEMTENGMTEELLGTARSYYEAREKLIYSIKGNTFLSGGPLYDAAHDNRGRIDCSTYVHLILQGIPYEKSPYMTGNPEDFFCPGSPWALKELADMLRRKEPVRRASQLAEYFWNRGMARTDSAWQSGDLLFFQVPPEKVDFYLSFGVFRAIYHIAIVAEDSRLMYESSGNQTVEVEKNYGRPGVRLSPVESRRAPIFYVRVRGGI